MLRPAAIVAAILAVVVALSGCAAGGTDARSDSAADLCPERALSDCQLELRVDAADEYAASRPGRVGFVVRDRKTGFVFRNEYANEAMWTASTIKLAMAADLLMRNRAQTIELTSDDRLRIEAMMHWSDDAAADILWETYSGPDGQDFNRNFAAFGITGLQPQPDLSFVPYWGLQKCTASDLDSLMQFVLTSLHPEDRDYLVGQMQNVAENQQWGVWTAGPDQAPGTKAGWTEEMNGRVINSVGFAGKDQRFTLAIMNSVPGEGALEQGVATTSQLAYKLLNDLD